MNQQACDGPPSLQTYLEKAISELMIQFLLSLGDMCVSEMEERVATQSRGSMTLLYPYAAVSRLMDQGQVVEREPRDGERRESYCAITDRGRVFLRRQIDACYRFIRQRGNAFSPKPIRTTRITGGPDWFLYIISLQTCCTR